MTNSTIDQIARLIIANYRDPEGDIDIAEIDGAIYDEIDDPTSDFSNLMPDISNFMQANFIAISDRAIDMRGE